MVAVFVSFEDWDDPTYASADGCVLVVTPEGASFADGNPASIPDALKIPVMPRSPEEIEAFAAIMGWSYDYDNDGQIILYTDTFVDVSAR